jgi:hypothetical protein
MHNDFVSTLILIARLLAIPANPDHRDPIVIHIVVHVSLTESCCLRFGLFGLRLDEAEDRSAEMVWNSGPNMRKCSVIPFSKVVP